MDGWGDGLITDRDILAANPLASDPNPFFEQLLTKPYLNQVHALVLCMPQVRTDCSTCKMVQP